jgi:hypothetical protein
MDSKKIVTRRTILGKGMVAGVAALGLSALARPASTQAKAKRRETTQGADTTCRVFCDEDGKNCKLCCYDQYGYPMGCTPITESTKLPR